MSRAAIRDKSARPGSRPPGRPAGARRGEARDALLRAARDLMAEKGLPRVTAREVAERAGVNPALVQYYFGGKKGLLRAVVEQKSIEAAARIQDRAASTADARTRLAGLIADIIRGFEEDPYSARLLFEQVVFADEDVVDRFVDEFGRSHIAGLQAVLEEGIAAGEFRDLDVESTIASISGACVFFFLGSPIFSRVFEHGPHTPETIDRFIECTIALVLDGLSLSRPPTSGTTSEEKARS